MKKIIFMSLIFLLLFNAGCIDTPPEKNETRVIGIGDTVYVEYILTNSRGEILDSNKNGSPLKIEIRDNNGFIEGFTYSLIGRENNDHYSVTIPPELGYGQKDPDMIDYQNRYYNVSLVQNYPREELETYLIMNGMFVEENLTFTYNDISYTILNYTDSYIVVKPNFEIGQIFELGSLNQTITYVDENYATIGFVIENGQVIYRERPQMMDGVIRRGEINIVNETTFSIDYNHELKGETLYFEIWILDVK
ncbi:FKBP-type peptidyl-prolyl cis-trans isomerase [Candidatus Micrarchaeota archaeon]|nr:FKBP-type peptidyl-prolyl cis-trans isomerase [Candidatus Micrarchaeota archaeon]